MAGIEDITGHHGHHWLRDMYEFYLYLLISALIYSYIPFYLRLYAVLSISLIIVYLCSISCNFIAIIDNISMNL